MVSAFLVGLLGLFVPGGHAQDNAAPKARRMLYSVKHQDAKELAAVLGKHFKDDAEIQALAGSPSNCLLVRSEPKVLEEVAKVLAEVDRRARLVSVEVIIAELPPKAGADEKVLDEKEFTGSAREVLDRVESHRKKGLFTGVKRFQFSPSRTSRLRYPPGSRCRTPRAPLRPEGLAGGSPGTSPIGTSARRWPPRRGSRTRRRWCWT